MGLLRAVFPTRSQVGQCIENEMYAAGADHFIPGYLNYFCGYIFPSTDTWHVQLLLSTFISISQMSSNLSPSTLHSPWPAWFSPPDHLANPL